MLQRIDDIVILAGNAQGLWGAAGQNVAGGGSKEGADFSKIELFRIDLFRGFGFDQVDGVVHFNQKVDFNVVLVSVEENVFLPTSGCLSSSVKTKFSQILPS